MEKPEETIKKFPMIQKIIELKDEFELFNQKFVDFSRYWMCI